jgi:exodeoxyribonuclease VII large subunit
MARLESSPEEPIPVRVVAMKIGAWISRLGEIWIDGQIAQLTRRPGMATQFLVLRDTDANVSLNVTCPRGLLDDTIGEGSRVVLRARPDFYVERGTLSLRATEIRQVGLGELLAQLERLRRVLAAEGLFAADRKRPLPFLPRRVGLITGRASAAERDIVENARRRFAAVAFRVENVATQGTSAVTDVVDALGRLDADPEVDVIVIARGGGAAEELLPFSNEKLLRVVSEARTPVVSAIGHDVDTPLLDFVADWRASTPTDAGRRVVPDAEGERRSTEQSIGRATRALMRRLDHERHVLQALRSRPVMADPTALVTRQRELVVALRGRSRDRVLVRVLRAEDEVRHLGARVRSLSPQSTLERGYAVVQHRDGRVVVSREEVQRDELLRVRVAHGDFGVRPVTGPDGEPITAAG